MMKAGFKAALFCTTALLLLTGCRGGQENEHTSADTVSDATENSSATAAESIPDETHTDPAYDNVSVTVQTVYPTPQYLSATGTVPGIRGKLRADGDAAAYATVLENLSLSDETTGLPLTVVVRDMSDLFSSGAEEAYELTITQEGVHIAAGSDRGVYYALITLGQLRDANGNLPCLTVRDAPAVPERGVIEGFYGNAWSHEFRLSLFTYMGQRKLNVYIYAPKDDAKHRSRWRDRYTQTELTALTELVQGATDNRVKFVYAISPGGDIDLGSGYSSDLKKLIAKCEQLYGIGVRDFAVLLDDIPTLDAEGHARLLNDFQDRFVRTHEGVSDLICITTEYTDPMLTSYTDRIAPLLDPALRLMWTGPGVVPASISESDLAAINRKYGRKVYIWWNYPVNDVLVDHLYLAPCQGLERTLSHSISGLVANPMNQANASLIPLLTTADYLWNPDAYDQDASLLSAVAAIDPDLTEPLLALVDMVGAAPLNGNRSTVRLASLLADWRASGHAPDGLEAFIAEADRLAEVGRLRDCRNEAFATEAADWIDKAEAYARMAGLYFRMEAEAAGEKRQDILLTYIGQYVTLAESVQDNSRIVSPDVLTPLISGLTQRINELSGLASALTCQPARGITNAAHYQDYTIDRICDGDDSTYFWSAGAMWQAAPGTTGYVGLDFGQVIRLDSLYIATGENGKDVFSQAAIEYSTDGERWTELCSGTFGEEIRLTDIGVQARFVRMRNTDTARDSWVKVRVFEANSNRVVAPDSNGSFRLTTSLPTYEEHAPELALDGRQDTFFWSSRGVEAGDYIMIDLGAPCTVHRIVLETGVPGHTADYMLHASLLYSPDGFRWFELGDPGNGRAEYDGLSVTARYIKLLATASQTNWFTMAEFSVEYDPYRHPTLTAEDDFVPATVLGTLTDQNILSCLTLPAGAVLTADIRSATTVRLLSLAVGEGTMVRLLDADGSVLSETSLTADLTLNCTSASRLIIVVGANPCVLAEIITE